MGLLGGYLSLLGDSPLGVGGVLAGQVVQAVGGASLSRWAQRECGWSLDVC